MKKIFKTPELRIFDIECEIICGSKETLGFDPSNAGNASDGDEGDAPVRMDIFNYGGLQ